MPALPTGTMTFLLTDVEGSTRLWDEHPEAMPAALVQHDAIVEFLTEQHHGCVVKARGEGDSRFCVFARATDAVGAALAIQRALLSEPWPTPTPLRVRMALHTGEADLREGDYYGPAVNRCARLRAIAHGGQTLLSGATHGLVRDVLPPDAALRDLGEQRLRDLAARERVYQLVGGGLLDAFPALRSVDAFRTNLPAQPTPFVGREPELAAVRALVRRREVRLLSLTGPGGAGKTRLALQAAADLLDDFPDGVFLVALGGLEPGAAWAVAPAIARALGARETAGMPPAEAVSELVGAKRVLLVLDNFEHVAAAAPEVATLLANCPRLTVLVTSRAALPVYGGHEYPVPPLRLPEAGDEAAPARLAGCEAVRLFVDRAREVDPGFALTAENGAAVAAICRRVDGLPLAIELAAARTRVFPPGELLARLDRRMPLLAGGPADRPPRQRTMRDAIAWSYDLLAPADRVLFHRLAVFAGGCAFDAAEAVCAPPGQLDPLAGIEALVASTLVRQSEVAGDARFAMLATIQEFAAERLTGAGEEEALRERHAAHYLALAERLDAERAGRPFGPWLERLDAERDNLRAAQDWLVRRGDRARAVRVGVALTHYWVARGLAAEGRGWLAAARALADSGPDGAPAQAAEARALEAEGQLANEHNDYGAAEGLLTESRARWRAAGDRAGEARVLRHLSISHHQQGDYATERVLLDEGLAIQRTLGDERGLLEWLLRQGDAAGDRGDNAAERLFAEEALALARRLGDTHCIGLARAMVGYAALREGRLDEARPALIEAERLFPFDAERGWVNAWIVSKALGLLALAEGDHAGARRRFAALLRWSTEMPSPFALAYTLDDFAVLAAADGHPARALRLAGAATAIRRRHRIPRHPSWRAHIDRWLAPARARLGAEAASVADREGQAMAAEQAVAYAQEDAPTGPAGGRRPAAALDDEPA